MKMKMFSHVVDLPNWESVLTEQLYTCIYSNLLTHIDTIFICLNGDPTSFEKIQSKFKKIDKIKFIQTSTRIDWYEWPTLAYLKQNIDSDLEDSFICYVHLKGLTKTDRNGLDSWREYITHWIIKRWILCVSYLEKGYDTVGLPTSTITGPNSLKCYSGNFWWATSNHIKSLKELPSPDVINSKQKSTYHGKEYDIINFRNDAELWVRSNNPNAKELNTKEDIL